MLQMLANLPPVLYTREQVRQLDSIAINQRGLPGLKLMRRAAQACVDSLLEAWPKASRVVVFCGSGNNAGDGYIVAGLLAERNIDVDIILIGSLSRLSDDATDAYKFSQVAGVEVRSIDACSDSTADEPTADDFFLKVDVIVDALLGTGMSGPVRPVYAKAIQLINRAQCHVLAVDLPSGLDADTGCIVGEAVQADITVTFIGLKQGLFTLDGPDQCGRIVYADLGVPQDIFTEVAPATRLLNYQSLVSTLPRRKRNAHKNRFGHVLVVGGGEGMGGAVAMTAEAALRAGAGLVSVATHMSHTGQILARRPELMVKAISEVTQLDELMSRASVIVLGPGLGKTAWSRMVFDRVIQSALPLVIDADGLNLLAETSIRNDDWILTPHPGEANTLITHRKPSLNDHGETKAGTVQQDRFTAAKEITNLYGGVVLLKGVGTIIHSRLGMSLCPYGNPGMSSAGMGDVLAGVIGGLLAQTNDQELATCLGAVVHSYAADLCAAEEGERGLLATDLLPQVRRLLNDV